MTVLKREIWERTNLSRLADQNSAVDLAPLASVSPKRPESLPYARRARLSRGVNFIHSLLTRPFTGHITYYLCKRLRDTEASGYLNRMDVLRTAGELKN